MLEGSILNIQRSFYLTARAAVARANKHPAGTQMVGVKRGDLMNACRKEKRALRAQCERVRSLLNGLRGTSI